MMAEEKRKYDISCAHNSFPEYFKFFSGQSEVQERF